MITIVLRSSEIYLLNLYQIDNLVILKCLKVKNFSFCVIKTMVKCISTSFPDKVTFVRLMSEIF